MTAFTISQVWNVIDADKVVVNFALKKEGTKGTFTGVDANIDFDAADPSKSSIKATVKVKSIDTQNKQRDGHLLTADFFDAEKYPTIIFASNEIVKTDKGFLAKGKLTMKDQTLDVEVPFTFEEDKSGKASLVGTMEVSPTKFGVLREKSKDEVVAVSVVIPLTK